MSGDIIVILELKRLFHDFLKNFTEELSKRQFALLSNMACAVFVKDESPVLYFVSAVDFDKISPEIYEESLNAMLADALDRNKTIFNNVICVNILYSADTAKALAFADAREPVREGKIHNVWWYTEGSNLYFGNGQPDRIYGIEDCVRRALRNGSEADTRSIGEINSEVSRASGLKEKSKYPVVIYGILAVNIIIFIIQTLAGTENLFIADFGINNALIFQRGQYYRLITYMFIHSGAEHIAFNSVSLYIYGSRVEKYCGKLQAAVIYIFSGITGGLISALFNDGYAVGASGAIFGLMAAMLAVTRRTGQKIDGLSYMTMLVIAVAGIGMGFLETGIDNFGHIGGFIGGLISGTALCRPKKE